MAEIDAEAELLSDGTLLVYVALCLEVLIKISHLDLMLYFVIFLTLIHQSFPFKGVAKQLQSFISELGMHQMIIPQNQ